MQCINDPNTGQNIICGPGELHVELCIDDLRNEFAQIEILKEDPFVTYKETVSEIGSDSLAKSQNFHNRLICNAEPLPEELVDEIECGGINFNMDLKEKTKKFVEFGFDKNEVTKIWAFGPELDCPNMILDVTKGCQYMHEIRDSLVMGFKQATQAGVLCEENVRGMRINVNDTHLHPDSIHRGAGQLMPAAKRVYYASQLKAAPRLQEPFYLCEVICPNDVVGNVYSCLTQKRSEIVSEEPIENSPLTMIKAYLPVAESFNFTSYLRSHTSGKAFESCSFHHYALMSSDPLAEAENPCTKVVREVRLRKGMKLEVEKVSEYEDKL